MWHSLRSRRWNHLRIIFGDRLRGVASVGVENCLSQAAQPVMTVRVRVTLGFRLRDRGPYPQWEFPGWGQVSPGGKCPAVCPPTGVAACWYLTGRCRRSLDSFQPGRHRTCIAYLYWQHCCRPGWSLAVRGGSHSRAFHTTHHRCNIYIFIRINCSFKKTRN